MNHLLCFFYIFANFKKEIKVNKYIPDYLIDKNNIILYLIFVFFYSILFVNVFTPFQGAWYNIGGVTRYQLFMYSVIIVFGGVFVLALSRMLMTQIHKRNQLMVIHYFAWSVFEFILIAILYTVSCCYGLHDERGISVIFGRAMMFIPLILVIPTIIVLLYLNAKEKDKIILALRDTLSTEEGARAVPEAPSADSSNDIINFTDEKGELKLSVKMECIYYLEASDNYINIFYRSKDDIEHFLLRSSMKKQEELLAQYGFVRCHRSYIVNFSKVALLRKDKNGPYLDLGEVGIKEIPISKTYLDSVTKHFTFPK